MPDWVKLIDIGEGPGIYGPDSAVWEVHGCVATLVGGIRALLLQAAHPAALAGVAQHSRYEKDFLGRLAGTARWLTITTFATQEAIDREAARVNAMHSHVSGEYKKKDGHEASYRANDPRFLLWVHCAFTDSFMKTHLALGYKIKAGADAYVREWSTSATGLGLTNAPKSQQELEDVMQDFLSNDLARSDKTAEVVKFILRPPVGRASLFFYSILANAAIASLSDDQRRILGLKKPRQFWLFLCRRILNILSAILGPESPGMQIARQRIARTQVAQ